MNDPTDLPRPIRTEGDRHPDDYLIGVQNDYKVGDLDDLADEDIQRIRAAYYGAITQPGRKHRPRVNAKTTSSPSPTCTPP